jgi:hypothetical protein
MSPLHVKFKVNVRLSPLLIRATQCWNFRKIYMGARNPVGNELTYLPASQCSLVGRYDNPSPTRFLAPIDCYKIPAQYKTNHGRGALRIEE